MTEVLLYICLTHVLETHDFLKLITFIKFKIIIYKLFVHK